MVKRFDVMKNNIFLTRNIIYSYAKYIIMQFHQVLFSSQSVVLVAIIVIVNDLKCV